MSLRGLLLATCLIAALPLQAVAQDKIAYVIGNTRFGGPALSDPAKDAVSISRALLGLGFDVVRRENVTAKDFPMANRSADTVALYYSGRTNVTEDGDILLRGAQLGDVETPGWRLLETARAFQAGGAQNVMIFIETCQTDGDSIAMLPEDTDLSGILLAVSHDPSLGCPVAEVEPASVEDGTSDAVSQDDSVADAEAETEDLAESSDLVAVVEENTPPVVRFTERVRLALATPDMPLSEAIETAAGAGWMTAALTQPFFMWPQRRQSTAPAAGTLPAGAMEMLDSMPEAEQQRMRKVWQDAGLMDAEGKIIDRAAQAASSPVTTILVAPSASSSGVTIIAPVSVPVNPVIPQDAPGGTRIAGRVTPVQPVAQRPQGNVGGGQAGSGGGGGVTNAVQIFTPTDRAAAPAALPTAAGLPEPYLIFGELRATNASFDPAETGEITGSAIDTSSFETRNQIRNDTPDLYQQLVEGGAFDPEDGTTRGLARAIQTELSRMSCYTSGIDGIWGNGSRRSVSAYFEQINEAPSGLEPTLDLYRKIIQNDDVSCPVAQQAAQPARNTGTTTRRNTTTSTPRAQQPARQQAPAASGGINTNNLGTGVFR